MKLELNLVDDAYGMKVSNERSQLIDIDAATDIGGKNSAFRPMELVAAGLAGCGSIDVLSILRKKRRTIHTFKVEVDAKRTDAIPAVFELIHLSFQIGGDATEGDIEQALKLTFNKYCSVSVMLAKTCEITYSYKIV